MSASLELRMVSIIHESVPLWAYRRATLSMNGIIA